MKENESTEAGPVVMQPAKSPRQKKLPKWLKVLLVLMLFVLIGLLLWLWLTCRANEADLQNKNKGLESQVEELTKQLEAEKKKSASGESSTSEPNACPAPSQALKDAIRDAVTSRNYAALESHMTNPITVVYAASEFGGPKTPAEAVAAMAYLSNGTAPWDFNLPAATIAGYQASEAYGQYFPAGAAVGKAANDHVASFGFKCDKINLFFTAINDDLL